MAPSSWLRYDRYDFLDADRGGEGTAWTLGVNWHLNNWSRLMLNYDHWKTDNKVGNAQGPDFGNTVGMRARFRSDQGRRRCSERICRLEPCSISPCHIALHQAPRGKEPGAPVPSKQAPAHQPTPAPDNPTAPSPTEGAPAIAQRRAPAAGGAPRFHGHLQ
ncbi:porin [Stenotrophomonas geniculata]|uniref:porin n=1 Tax=Stenotrophomonas geniculata TaxID=86188 RepID=UPI003AAF6421